MFHTLKSFVNRDDGNNVKSEVVLINVRLILLIESVSSEFASWNKNPKLLI